ncbi:MAG: thiamine pyrophosphate-binding protein [Chloroflexota bacterium]
MPEPDERSRAIIDGLEAIDPRYVLHLPSSTLTEIINHMLARPNTTTFPIPREEEGVGILAGLELAGSRAVAIIQDNGIGNLLTALTTFPMAYHIPQFYIVSRRGGLNEYNSMIHTICDRVPDVLNAADVRYFDLDGRTPIAQWAPTVQKAYDYSRITHRPVMLLINLMGG